MEARVINKQFRKKANKNPTKSAAKNPRFLYRTQFAFLKRGTVCIIHLRWQIIPLYQTGNIRKKIIINSCADQNIFTGKKEREPANGQRWWGEMYSDTVMSNCEEFGEKQNETKPLLGRSRLLTIVAQNLISDCIDSSRPGSGVFGNFVPGWLKEKETRADKTEGPSSSVKINKPRKEGLNDLYNRGKPTSSAGGVPSAITSIARIWDSATFTLSNQDSGRG